MSTYISFPYCAHIHGEETSPSVCWPLPKGAVHRRGVSPIFHLNLICNSLFCFSPFAEEGYLLPILVQQTPSVSSFESLDSYVSSKGAAPSTKIGTLAALKLYVTPTTRAADLEPIDAIDALTKVLEKDAKAQISFVRHTLPAFAASIGAAVVAALPFKKVEPQPEPAGYDTLRYLWSEAFEEDD